MAEEAKPVMTFAEFLMSVPPGRDGQVSDLARVQNGRYQLTDSDLELFCSSQACDGLRIYQRFESSLYLGDEGRKFGFAHYRCRNCLGSHKVFALFAQRDSGKGSGTVFKFGEVPAFGPPVPSRVISLIGPDSELFLQGRRAENQGMGIGAFGYYRRVVENQKGRIIREMGRVAEKLGATPEVVELFARAAGETQFEKAIDLVKHAIPPVLTLDGGHNPLTLLHSVLSEGLHELTDKENLQLAQDIRLVLTDLAERITEALKDRAELHQAVSTLLERQRTRAKSK